MGVQMLSSIAICIKTVHKKCTKPKEVSKKIEPEKEILSNADNIFKIQHSLSIETSKLFEPVRVVKALNHEGDETALYAFNSGSHK